VTCCALIHHVFVVGFSVLYNKSYMKILQDGIMFRTADCSVLAHETSEIYYSGIFCIVYLAIDTYYGILAPTARAKNLDYLLLYHHVNGIVLMTCSIYWKHGLYMTYIAHAMELSSIFLGFKVILKEKNVSKSWRTLNDAVFALSFVICRLYLTLSSVFIAIQLFSFGCWDTMTFVDVLVVYCVLLYSALTGFWTFGILRKLVHFLFYPSSSSADDKED
jgi:hypothetical protein